MIDYDGVYDIECSQWDQWVVGAILDARTGDVMVSWDEDEYYAELRGHGGTLWAHAGGRYDGLWALARALASGDRPRLTGAGARLLAMTTGGTTLRDSYALVPLKLADCKWVKQTKRDGTGLKCVCGEDCGGYCAITKKMSRRDCNTLRDYLVDDCRALHAVMLSILEWAEEYDLDLRPTVGATAWATAQRWGELDDAPRDLALRAMIREAAYGGRTEVYDIAAPRVYRFDRHAAYVAAIRDTALPIGEPRIVNGRAASSALQRGAPGVYRVDVTIPEMDLPPLPCRVDGGGIVYPYGPVSGSWCRDELQAAVERGVTIERVTSAVVWPRESKWLEPFASRVWGIRDSLPGDKGGKWFKWVGNSMTGKLGQRDEIDSYTWREASGDVPECDDGENVIWSGRGADGKHWNLVIETMPRAPKCGHLGAYCTLTASARVEYLCEHESVPESKRVYGDTDSCYAKCKVTRRIGKKLGEWGYEGSGTDWTALAPKLYSYTDEDGDRAVRGRGLAGLTPEGFDAIEAGGEWRVRTGVDGLRTGLRSERGVFSRRDLGRRSMIIDGWRGSRELPAGETRTRPTTLDRFASRGAPRPRQGGRGTRRASSESRTSGHRRNTRR